MHERNLDVYVIGSNSKFLSSDIITEFRGRGDEISDTKEVVLNKINKSLDNKFGISINCTKLSNNDIIKHFNQISLLLNKVK